ncbi:MAG: cation:proton antiporter [Gemmatimonadota bacterium]|jgi:hypothetical protein
MDPILGTLVLILVALLGARISFSTERVSPGPRLLFRTGMQFLVIGFLLGPSGLSLITDEAAQQLSPLLALGLGWVGFHFGLQLDRESLRHFKLRVHLVALGQALLSFALFLGGALALLELFGIAADVPLLLPLGAAATAAVTTPAGIALVSSNFLVRGKVRDLLFLIGSLDAVVGITALQLTYSFYRPSLPGNPAAGGSLLYTAAATALGLALGIVFTWLTRRRPRSEELVLYVLGACAFTAGAALQWGLSPLFLSAVMGFTVANLGRERARVFLLLQRWEKPVYLIFLLLAGALLRIPGVWVFALAAGYALLRALAKVLGAAAMAASVPLGFDVPRRLGFGLIPQGGISIAMAVSGVLLYSDLEVRGVAAETTLFTVIVVGVMLSELAGPFMTVRLLRRAGEISPRVEEAIAAGDERRAEREALRHASRSPPP